MFIIIMVILFAVISLGSSFVGISFDFATRLVSSIVISGIISLAFKGK